MRQTFFKRLVILACALIALTRVEPAFANPLDGVVAAGSATITTTNPTTVHIAQHSDRAVIDWRGFDIAPSETTEFVQPTANSIALNRVNSTSASQINGRLTANGNVVIVNQNGVVFGAGAQVDANSLVVSTADTDNSTFMAGGKLQLNKASSNPDAAIINKGQLTAKEAGLVGLVAPDVENQGIITARLGRAQLASGDTATVDLYGDGLLEVAVSDNVTKQLVKNTGTIAADGGVVALTAATGKSILTSSIAAEGTLTAQTVSTHQGAIIIASAASTGRSRQVIVTAKLDASGKHAGEKGGAIHVLGDNVALLNGAHLDASGVAGGGEILVSGDVHGGLYQGAQLTALFPNGVVPTASRVFVANGVDLLAAATGAGNGGRVVVWSDQGTVFNGFADVGAYGASGNGGFIETSGHDFLQLAGSVNASAAHGTTGIWLLDPADITISNAADSVITAASPFGSTGGATSNLSVATLVSALNGAANVIISSAAGTGGLGNITFVDAVSWNSVRSLTVNASNNIIVNNTITNAGSGDINLNANVAAAGSITVNSAISTAGNINLLANQDVNVAAGLSGSGISVKAANGVTSGTGNLNLTGNLTLGTGPLTLISGINGTRPSWTMDATTLAHAGSFGGAVDIEGFNVLTVNRALALTTGNNLKLANNTLINLNNNLSVLGAGTVTMTGPVVLPEASAVAVTTGGGSVTFGGTVTGTPGGVVETLAVNSGAGTTSFTGALNGFDPTISAATITVGSTLGATTTMGAVVLTAVNALSLPDITATTITLGTSGAAGDISVNGNLNSAGAVVVTAFRDLTLAAGKTITAGGAGNLSLKAANGSTGGTGNLTLNGSLTIGSGALTLYSGVNGTRPSWTASATSLVHAGSFNNAVDLEGFNVLTLSRALDLAAGNLTIANNTSTVLGANLSTLGTGTITVSNPVTILAGATPSVTSANQNITLGAITGGSAASTLTTNSGTATTSFGVLNNFGLTATAGTLTLGGTLGSTTTMGAVALTAASALTLPDITATSFNAATTNATADITANGNITSTGAVSIIAMRDLTLAAAKTITAGSTNALTLEAANGVTSGTGNLNLNGNLNVGTGALTLISGINGTRPSWTANATTLVNAGSFGPIDIEGFTTLTIGRAITMAVNNSLSFANNTSLVLGGNLTTSGTGSISITNPTTIAAGSSVTVTTANQPITFSNTVTGGSAGSSLTTNSGTATTTFTGNLNNFGLTATAGTVSLGGSLGQSTTMGAVTLAAVNALTLPDITAASFTATTSGATADIAVNGNLTSAGAVTITAFRDLTLAAGKTITTAGTGALSLKAANGVTSGTGNLNLNGNLSHGGSGAATLYSGINGTRPSWTADATTLAHTGSFGGAVDIEGFNTLTINRPLMLTTGNNLTLTNNTATVLNGGQTLSTLGAGTITINGPITLAEASATTITTGGGNVTFGGAVAGTPGGVAETMNVNAGTGTVTFTGALNGFDPTVTAATISFGSTLGATTAMGAVALTATNALTLPAITAASLNVSTSGASGSVTAGGDITTTGNTTITTAGTAADIAVNGNVAAGGNVTMTAFRNLTLAAAKTITTGATGSLSLKAANGVPATGVGALTLNGNLSVGTGTLTLYSGTTRPSWTPTTSNLIAQGANFGNVDIEGFATLTLSRAFNLGTNNTLTIANNTSTVLSQNLSTTGTGTITISNPLSITAGAVVSITTANQPIVLGAITGGSAASSLTTNSGTAATTFGVLNNFILTATANNFTFGGTLGATTTMGAVTINDVAAVTLPDITAASVTVTSTGATGDITTGNITSTGDVIITAFRDLNIATGKTVTANGSGNLTLKAANGATAGTGNLNIVGNVGIGTGALTLYSGINGARPSWTATATSLVHAGNFNGPVDIEGFNVLTVSRAFGLSANQNLSFANNTSLALGSGSSLSTLGTGTINITNPVTIVAGATPTVTTANQAITFGSTITGGSAASSLTTSSGTATTTFTGNLNNFILNATADTITFGGTLGQTTTMAAVTLNSVQALMLPTITAASLAATTTGATGDITAGSITATGAVTMTSARDLTTNGTITTSAGTFTAARDIAVNGNITSTGAAVLTAARDLTEAAGKTITAAGTGALTLKAAGGAVAGTGNLTLNGNVAVGTGAVTLISGINGARPSFTASATTLSHAGSFGGTVDMEGFNILTIARPLVLTAGNILIANNTGTSINGSALTTAGTGTITISNPLVIQDTFAPTFSTANAAITLGTVDGTAGGGAESLTTNSGTATTTYNGAINGISLTGTAGTFVINAAMGAVTPLTTVALTSTNALTLPDVALTGNFTATTTTGNIIASGNILSSAGNILIKSFKDLTLSTGKTIASGPAGSFALEAANNVVTGTGNLVLNGTISPGTGALTLLSGVNGTRPNWTADATNFTPQGTLGAVSITGINALTFNTDLISSGNINVISYGDLTLNAANTIRNGAASTLTLDSGGGSTGSAGISNLNGVINAGSGALTLVSGVNGSTRANYTIGTTNFTPQSTFGAITASGYQDFVINRNLASSSNINIVATRDLTVNSGMTVTTGATGSLTLKAASGSTGSTGNLTLSGVLNVGNGATTLYSGLNGTRPSWTITTSNFIPQSTFGALDIEGLQDVTVNRNLSSNGNITIIAVHDLTLNSGMTVTPGSASALTLESGNGTYTNTGNLTLSGVLAPGTGAVTLISGSNGTRPSYTLDNTTFNPQGAGVIGALNIRGIQTLTFAKNITSNGDIVAISVADLNVNSGVTVTTGAAGQLALEAAAGSIGNPGNLNILGTISGGTGALTLISGVNGTRPSVTFTTANLVPLTTFGAISITGYQDLTLNRNLASSGNISIIAQRDLTENVGMTITPGATGALTLEAANNVIAGTGNLNLNGNIAMGSGALTLHSGINGTRPNYVTTNLTQQGATVGVVDIQGFQDFTLDNDLVSSGNVSIISQRDLTINSGRTLATGATGALTLEAANANINGTGDLYINGILKSGTGNFTLRSGLNPTRSSYSPDATTLLYAGATFGNIDWQGFATLDVKTPIISSGTVNFGNAANILENDITATNAVTFPNATVIAEGKTIHITTTNDNVTFNSTLDGTAGGSPENLIIVAGTGTVTFSAAVGGSVPLGILTINADNLTLSSTLAGTGALIIAPQTAGRAVNIGTATTDADTTAGLNLTTAENGRIVDGWSSITFGNLISGDVTNNYATYTDPVKFQSGNDFINAVALSDSGGPIFIQALRDVVLNQNLVTNDASANAITLVAGRNFVNTKGAGVLTTGAGGRWLIYSTNPAANTGATSLVNNFNRYSCTYGGSCPALGTGNGMLYSTTPLLTITISGQTYNYGDAVIVPTGYVLQTSGYLNPLDSGSDSITGTGIFQTSYVQGQHAGTGYVISNNGSTLLSSTGYGFTYVSNNSGVVGTRAITVSAADQSRIYGFGSLGTTGFNVTTSSLYGTDVIGSVVLSTNATTATSGQYNISAVGTPWTIGVSGANFTSGLASDYAVSYTGASTGLTITKAALTVTASGISKVYDGLVAATVTLGDNRVAGDVLTLGYSIASFPDKNVGTGRAVSVSGITVTGTDSGNYIFNTTASTTANITAKALTVTASGISKVYDGLAAATVTLGDNRVAGDVLTLGYGAASFPDKNVGTGRAVSVSGITVTGTDSGNYTFNSTASTAANITQKALTVSATGINKVYDGLAAATVTLGDNRVTGDVLTLGYGAASFPNKNTGTGRAVSVSGITVTGTDSGNYTFNSTASTTANITQKALTVTATGIDKVYNGLAAAAVTLGDDRISGDVLTLGYGAASFPDKNVGAGRAVSVSGITVTGTDSGNYTFNTTASTTANITAKALTVSATGVNKVYDGLAAAVVTLGDNRVAGDVLTLGYGAASFPDKNVGTGRTVNVSAIIVTGTDSGNYTFNTTASTTANITAKVLTVSATGISKVYDGLAAATVTLGDNRIAGDVLTLGYGSANFPDKNVGMGRTVNVSGITVTGTDSGNYTFNTTASTTANITAKALTVTASGIDKVYNGLAAATVTLGDNRVAGDVLTLVYGAASFPDKNVGTGRAVSVSGITVTGTDSGNYTFNTTASTTANITAKALTVTASGINKVYNGLAAATVTLGDNRVAGDVLTVGYGAAGFPDKNVGTGRAVSVSGITVTGTDSGNYTFSSTASTTANITQAALTVTASGIDKVYNGLAAATVTLGDNRITGDVLTIGYGAASFPDKNVGTGRAVNVSSITVTGTDSGNYTFNSTASTTANITQAALTVTASGISKVYDGLAAATVTLGDNRIAGDVLTLGYGSASFPDKNVGTGRTVNVSGITVTGTDSGNYTFNTTASTTANVTAKVLTVSASGISKMYDGLATATVTLGDNRVAGDVLTLGYGAASFPDKNAGMGRAVSVSGITVTGTDSGNYTFSTTASTTANITKAALTVTASGISKVYDGLAAATVTLGDNRVAGDVLTLGYGTASFPDKNVGTGRAVSVSGITVTGTDSGNYIFNTTASTTANITAKALTVTASGISKVYDGLAAATVTLGDNRVAGDVLTLGYGAASFPDKNVGTGRAVSVSGITVTGTDSGNYTFNSTASTTANITQKALTVTATAADKIYDALTTAGVTLGDNRVTGDVLTINDTTANFTNKNVNNNKTVNVTGITVTGIDSGNYTFNTSATDTANITPRALTVSATALDKVYDGVTTASVVLGDDRVAGDVLTLGHGSATFADKNVANGKLVTVNGITVMGTDSGNYAFNTTATDTANITPRALTIAATGISKVYDGLAAATVTLSDNQVAGDVLTLGYGSASFPDKNVGTGRAVSVSGITVTGADSGNYSFNTTAGTTANITKAALTVTANAADKVYNGLTTAGVTLGDDRVAGDMLTIADAAANFTNKNAGTGKTVNVTGITVTGIDSGNYTFNTSATDTANITPKALTVTTTAADKVYDGLTTASVTLSDDRIAGDVLTLGYGSATFTDKDVANGKLVTVNGITVTGTDSGNYTFNTSATDTANITPKALTVTANAADKIYDGLTTVSVTLGDNRVAGDALIVSDASESFANKNAGSNKVVTISGITVTGADSGNYTFNTTATDTANITKAALSVTATAVDKVYNGLTTAGVTLGDNRVAGDVLTISDAAANFTNKNVGAGKTVNVTGITVTGIDSGNYTFNTSATDTANITPRALTVSATALDKVYDGVTTASVVLGDNRVAGDVLTLGHGSATFTDKDVANGKLVTVNSITVLGTDSGNYTFNTTATDTANITPRALTVSATALDKVYDGLATASVTLGDNRVAGDVLTINDTSASFANKNAGSSKVVTVNGITVMGTDSGNYTFNTTATDTANITKRTLTITATAADKIYDALTTASATLGDDRIAGDVLAIADTAANFTNKNAGTGKTVNVTGITVTGTDSGNYTFNTSATDTANITPKALTIGATGIDKVYNGLTTADVTLSDNRVTGDVLGIGYTANFMDKNVGAAKAISVSGITLAGTDAGNYTFNTTAGTAAAITPRALTVSASAADRAYDGTTNVSVTLGDNRVTGDSLNLAYGSASFADAAIGTGKPVSVSGITAMGTDSGNYSFNSSATATATIFDPAAPPPPAPPVLSPVADATVPPTVTQVSQNPPMLFSDTRHYALTYVFADEQQQATRSFYLPLSESWPDDRPEDNIPPMLYEGAEEI